MRLVPCFLVDIAGLVPGASEGRGRGNAFLADLANCNALIQVVDAAGSTDLEGNPQGHNQTTEVARARVIEEIEFLGLELDAWITGLLMDGWVRGVRRVQAEGDKGLISFIHERLTGLGATLQSVGLAYEAFRSEHTTLGSPWDWDLSIIASLAVHLRKALFPIHIAANKFDVAPQKYWTAWLQMAALFLAWLMLNSVCAGLQEPISLSTPLAQTPSHSVIQMRSMKPN